MRLGGTWNTGRLSAVPGDLDAESTCGEESTINEGEEVPEETLESHTPNAEASLPMSEDVDMMIEVPGTVNIIEHEKDDSVSPC